jgi:hypothetical protein
MPIKWEIRLASLIVAGGLIWAVYTGTQNFNSIDRLAIPHEAAYTSAIGLLVWLHAKWRRSIDMRRV